MHACTHAYTHTHTHTHTHTNGHPHAPTYVVVFSEVLCVTYHSSVLAGNYKQFPTKMEDTCLRKHILTSSALCLFFLLNFWQATESAPHHMLIRPPVYPGDHVDHHLHVFPGLGACPGGCVSHQVTCRLVVRTSDLVMVVVISHMSSCCR